MLAKKLASKGVVLIEGRARKILCLPLPYVRYSLFEFLAALSEFSDRCKYWIIYCYPKTCFLVKL